MGLSAGDFILKINILSRNMEADRHADSVGQRMRHEDGLCVPVLAYKLNVFLATNNHKISAMYIMSLHTLVKKK